MHLRNYSAKGLNSYVNTFCKQKNKKINVLTFLKTCFHFVVMGYCVKIDEEKQ